MYAFLYFEFNCMFPDEIIKGLWTDEWNHNIKLFKSKLILEWTESLTICNVAVWVSCEQRDLMKVHAVFP